MPVGVSPTRWRDIGATCLWHSALRQLTLTGSTVSGYLVGWNLAVFLRFLSTGLTGVGLRA